MLPERGELLKTGWLPFGCQGANSKGPPSLAFGGESYLAGNEFTQRRLVEMEAQRGAVASLLKRACFFLGA